MKGNGYLRLLIILEMLVLVAVLGLGTVRGTLRWTRRGEQSAATAAEVQTEAPTEDVQAALDHVLQSSDLSSTNPGGE